MNKSTKTKQNCQESGAVATQCELIWLFDDIVLGSVINQCSVCCSSSGQG